MNSVGGQVIDRLVGDAGQERVANYIPVPLFEDILKACDEEGVFNGNGKYTPEYSESGSQILTPYGSDLSSAIQYLSAPTDILENINGIKSYIETSRSKSANAMNIMYRDVFDSTYNEYVRFVRINLYNIPNENRELVIQDGNSTANTQQDCLGYLDFRFLMTSKRNLGTGYNLNTDITSNWLNGVFNDGTNTWYVTSTIGSKYSEPNPAVIYNPENVNLLDYRRWRETFTDWLQGTWELPRFNPFTGLNEMIEMIPIQLPDIFGNQALQPLIDPLQQIANWTGKLPLNDFNPNLLPEFVTKLLDKGNDLFDNFKYPETSVGIPPIVTVPSNTFSNKLYTVYNPSDANLNSLGGYLWDDSIIRQLVELFKNNPMDAVISLHQIYCTPTTGGNKNIILGTLNSGVPAPVVTEQYVTINCGTVRVPEMYNDARDYIYSECDIFLPFIGIRSIDCHDIINCNVTVLYTIDVYTGCLLAELRIKKDNVEQTLYTFEGNCSVQIPLTSADRARLIQTLTASATGLITGGVGTAIAKGAMSLASGGAQHTIQKSSTFSGNAGAMGCKIPYIIVTRYKSADASNYPSLIGNPTNKSAYLKDYKGFTRIKEIHLDSLNCTKEEKDLLMGILKTGIIV